MTKYLLSTHTVEDETREPRTEEEMHAVPATGSGPSSGR